MAGTAKENLTQFEKTNNIQEITSADEIYAYDASFQQSILQTRPWLQKYDNYVCFYNIIFLFSLKSELF